jgi:anti-sigma28 factor (negative regulator of flagellin synthesis)
MSSIPSLNPSFNTPLTEVIGRIGPRPDQSLATPPKADSVELSAEALAHTADLPADQARGLRLAAIKAQIDSGTYTTDDKLTVVADKLARQFGG